ncbi:MAG: hypothetical protein ACK5LT_06105 [Lachnospirales bacterium]
MKKSIILIFFIILAFSPTVYMARKDDNTVNVNESLGIENIYVYVFFNMV